jgi:predicted phage replisome organizer
VADVKWIKIVTDIFDDEKILLIESLPSADSIIVIWFKLLCLAGKNNNSGVFMLNDKIPYTEEMFSTIFRREISTVRLALSTFEKFGMVEIINDVITIPNWSKHQNLDQLEQRKEYMRDYMQGYREKQKQITTCKVNSKANSKANVNSLEEELDKERDKEDKKENKKYTVYFPNDEKLNQTFLDFIEMRKSLKNGTMTERAISMMITKLSKLDNDTAIQLLEKSITNNWKDIYMPEQKKDFQSVIKEWGND